MQIIAQALGKYYGEFKIFRDVNFEVNDGQSIAITGPNGSGKTTLMRIICGLLRPSMGDIEYIDAGTKIDRENIYNHIGFVGPYLELYEELSAQENMDFFARLRNIPDSAERITELMQKVNLTGREDDAVKTYSSGMRQRLKYVFALLNRPKVLLLDEPTSNLDVKGIDIVYDIMAAQKKENILILATNDEADLKFGDKKIAVSA